MTFLKNRFCWKWLKQKAIKDAEIRALVKFFENEFYTEKFNHFAGKYVLRDYLDSSKNGWRWRKILDESYIKWCNEKSKGIE